MAATDSPHSAVPILLRLYGAVFVDLRMEELGSNFTMAEAPCMNKGTVPLYYFYHAHPVVGSIGADDDGWRTDGRRKDVRVGAGFGEYPNRTVIVNGSAESKCA
jgi:hypothetical protein